MSIIDSPLFKLFPFSGRSYTINHIYSYRNSVMYIERGKGIKAAHLGKNYRHMKGISIYNYAHVIHVYNQITIILL